MRIRIYATLRDLLGTNAVDLPLAEPAPVGTVLRQLAAHHPALGEKLWDDSGRMTGLVTVLLNGRSIEYLAGMETPITDSDTLSLFPPVGGG